MEVTEPSDLELASASPEWSRPPLSSVANSPPQTPTLSQPKRVRRKSSLIYRVNSSEDIPSSHESIFHAERFSDANSEDDGSGPWPKITLSSIITPIASISPVGSDENKRDQLLAPIIGRTPILYGHGTALTTIVEQKSTTTISTKASSVNPQSTLEISLGRAPIPNLLGHRNSFDLPSTVTLRSPRRRRSFSADDLIIIKRSYHEACAIIERGTSDSLQIHDIYAEPRTPILPPIERPPTPPGMPSWTAAQNGAAQNTVQPQNWSVAGSQNRFQRFLGITSGPAEFSSRIPGPVALQRSHQSTQVVLGERSASNPLQTRLAPRFRPTRSGHGTGLLESHPFHRFGRADTKSDGVSTFPGSQTSIPLLSTLPGAPQRVTKAANSSKKRQVRYPQVAGSLQISRLNAFASRPVTSGNDQASSRCPHRRGRQASLRSLNHNSEVAIPHTSHSTVSYTLIAPNESQRDSTQQPIPSPAATEPHAVNEIQAHISPEIRQVMTGAVAVTTPTATPPIGPMPQTHRCWKCNVSRFVSALDDVWEASTSWCCWVFCGVGLYDDGESQGCGRGNEAALGPRRVVIDGMPVMLY